MGRGGRYAARANHMGRGAHVQSKSARSLNASHPCSIEDGKASGKTSTYHFTTSPRRLCGAGASSWTRSAHPKTAGILIKPRRRAPLFLRNPSDPPYIRGSGSICRTCVAADHRPIQEMTSPTASGMIPKARAVQMSRSAWMPAISPKVAM